jgi:hypothetical protein
MATHLGNQLVKEPDLYSPDPGGTFASDAHRRVMAHLPNPDDDPITADALILERINHDPNTLVYFTDADQVTGVLRDLEADGHAKQLKAGWQNTQSGFDILTGPPSPMAAQNAPALIGLNPSSAQSNGDA